MIFAIYQIFTIVTRRATS